jgi:uncharacterized protein (DUF488 family)
MVLYTIGYEGLQINTFFSVLKEFQIDQLIDVRELPLSRKKGFSKTSLGKMSSAIGIAYKHIRELGCPKQIRYAYSKNHDWTEYTNFYLNYLQSQDQSIRDLAEIVYFKKSCLLCFESNPHRCHRYYVAEAVQRVNQCISITHLEPKTTENPVLLEPLVDRLSRQSTIYQEICE